VTNPATIAIPDFQPQLTTRLEHDHATDNSTWNSNAGPADSITIRHTRQKRIAARTGRATCPNTSKTRILGTVPPRNHVGPSPPSSGHRVSMKVIKSVSNSGKNSGLRFWQSTVEGAPPKKKKQDNLRNRLSSRLQKTRSGAGRPSPFGSPWGDRSARKIENGPRIWSELSLDSGITAQA